MKSLPRRFYTRETLTVAEKLLGKQLVRHINNSRLVGKIVEAESKQVHHRKCSRDGKRERQAGGEGRGEVAEKKEDDQDHQADGQEKSELHIGN